MKDSGLGFEYIDAVNATETRTGTAEDDLVLQLDPRDFLEMRWGGVVSQRAGVASSTPFGKDESYWLLYVNRGRFHAMVGDNVYVVPKGCALVLLPGEPCIHAQPNETDLRFQWIAFKIQQTTEGRSASIRVPRLVRVRDQIRLAESISMLTEEFHARQPHLLPPHPMTSPGVRFLLLSILARLDHDEPDLPPNANVCSALAERAKDYIRTNLNKAISTSDIARALDCSPGHLGVVFRKTYGETVMDYILRTRVSVAKALLRETRMSVSQIAAEVGFSSLNYFTRVFRRHFGVTPSAYRVANSHLQVTTGI